MCVHGVCVCARRVWVSERGLYAYTGCLFVYSVYMCALIVCVCSVSVYVHGVYVCARDICVYGVCMFARLVFVRRCMCV